MTRYRIPVRVTPSGRGSVPAHTEDAQPSGRGSVPAHTEDAQPSGRGSVPAHTEDTQPSGQGSVPAHTEDAQPSGQGSVPALWRDRALRLQAEMDNYRQRQRRLAHEQAAEEQSRLLADILAVADDLERTLAAAKGEAAGRGAIRRGVELTRDKLLRTLRKYGVERVEAQGQPFDPAWHEAVEVTAAGAVEAGTVAEVRQPGYRRGERLLRPARVVVAQ